MGWSAIADALARTYPPSFKPVEVLVVVLGHAQTLIVNDAEFVHGGGVTLQGVPTRRFRDSGKNSGWRGGLDGDGLDMDCDLMVE